MSFEPSLRTPPPLAPSPWVAPASSVAFSPDGRYLSFLLCAARMQSELYVRDLQDQSEFRFVPPASISPVSSEDSLTYEEKMRRERLRLTSLGITTYEWAKNSNIILLPIDGNLCTITSSGSFHVAVAKDTQGSVTDAHLSPDGSLVAFLSRSELWVASAQAGGAPPRTVTSGAEANGVTHGAADFLAQEEMDRMDGYWWSPDSKFLAFQETAENHIPAFRIVHPADADPNAHEEHRYPFAGSSTNPRVRLGVVEVARGPESVRWLDIHEDGSDSERYLCRVDWSADSTALFVQTETRDQKKLCLLRFERDSLARSVVLVEEAPFWINLHNCFVPLRESSHSFLWASERSGFRHLYLHRNGQRLQQLTDGEWVVDSVERVDEVSGFVYFSGTRDSPLEKNLYQVPLTGGPIRRLTGTNGWHACVVEGCGRTCCGKPALRFADSFSSLACPPSLAVHVIGSSTDAPAPAPVSVWTAPIDIAQCNEAFPPPELITLRARDGLLLYGAVLHPFRLRGSQGPTPCCSTTPSPSPLIVHVYGGPSVQRVTDSWTLRGDVRCQRLAALGYTILYLDNRGSSRRGTAFENEIYGNAGDKEVLDQVDGVNHLATLGLIDRSRVGILGWSYGGYMSVMCLARAPDVFKVAVAGAPVTHWDGYDTHYTERYMGHPRDNASGYHVSSCMAHVQTICGKLLLVHGCLDENVHFRHTTRLIAALIDADKDYDLIVLPDDRHCVRKGREYFEKRVIQYFTRHLPVGG